MRLCPRLVRQSSSAAHQTTLDTRMLKEILLHSVSKNDTIAIYDGVSSEKAFEGKKKS